MGDIREKIPMIIIIVLAILICIGAAYFIENNETIYYTQIDNNRIKTVSASDDMKCEYTLECYKENGKKKELKFKTSRELREDAYLMLEVRSLGVHSWKEVKFEELPDKVKLIYNK